MLGAGYRIEEVRALLQQNRLHLVMDALNDVLADGKRQGVPERLAARLRGMVLVSGNEKYESDGNEWYDDARSEPGEEIFDNQPSHETPREPRGPHPVITPGTLVVNSKFSGRSTRLLASRRRRI